MTQRVFISSSQTATFVCPQCGKSTTVNVAKYAQLDKRVTVKCNCTCGHHFDAVLEKRKQYRKQTRLPGAYVLFNDDGPQDKGIMTVMDISSTGLKLKLNIPPGMKVGDVLKVEFHLDDNRRTLIEKQVIVRNIKNDSVGTAFGPTEGDDPALGFYLLS